MADTATPHINPKGAPIAETVLMPGDPLRAQFIADTYLEDVICFNEVRNMLGFTGTYQGHEVSVMGSGMGIPSMSLYSWELFNIFGAKKIVRVGSCGSLQKDLGLYEVVVAQGACTDSNFMSQYNLPGTFAPLASYRLLEALQNEATKQGVTTHVGNVVSSDVFYNADSTVNERWSSMGVLGVEMESAGLYAVAAASSAEALGLFTVSDNIVTGEQTSADERQTAFTTMMELALPLAAV